MKRFYMNLLYLFAILSVFSGYACKNLLNKYTSPQGYDFNAAEKFNMPSSLLEISGITFNNGISDTIYSVQDEEGKLYRQKWDVKKQSHMKFAGRGDYEDLSIFNNMVFILKSNGTIYSFPLAEAVKEESRLVKENKKLVPKAEYEGMYADPQTNKLYVLCKSCDRDKKKKQVTVYMLDYDAGADSLKAGVELKIDLSKLKSFNRKLKNSLKPAALAKHPKTGEWYVLSSTDKVLLITDANWKIKAAHKLNSSTFNQPEGIAFDQQLNLYISNEGDEVADGNILKFSYLAEVKK